MKTLDEHNEEHTSIYHKGNGEKAGVLCPGCGNEMIYHDSLETLTIPPKRKVRCEKCDFINWKRG